MSLEDEQLGRTMVWLADSSMEEKWLTQSGASLVRSTYLGEGETVLWIEPNCRRQHIYVDLDGQEYCLNAEPILTGGVSYKKGDPYR